MNAPSRGDDLPFAVEFDDRLRQQDDTRVLSDSAPMARTLRLLHDVLRRSRTPVDEGATQEQGESPSEGFLIPAAPRGLPSRFRVQRLLGKGGFGLVYLATDDVLSRDVAIKIPHHTEVDNGERKARFLRESRAVARLNHPNIVRVLDSGESMTLTDSGHPIQLSWQVAEFVDGPHLNQLRQEQGGHLPPTMAARIVSQLADAIHHAHEHGVLHRDIKPENVLMERVESETVFGPALDSWRPRLTDFGLARLSDTEIELSRSGVLIGTPRYMAPEQLRGQTSQQGSCTDIYSLGVLLHELLTGLIPFPEAGSLHSRIKMADVPVPSFRRNRPGISLDLETICLKCLQIKATDRYHTAGQLRDDLNRFLDGRATLARPLPIYEQVFRWGAENRALGAALVFSLFAIVLAFAQALYSNRISQQQNITLKNTLNQLTTAKEQSDRLRQLAETNRVEAVQNESRFRTLAWDSSIREAFATLQRKRYFTTHSILTALQQSQPEKQQRLEWQLAECELGHHYLPLFSAPHSLYEMCSIPGTDLLAIAGNSNRVVVIDINTGEVVQEIPTEINKVHAIAVSADGESLAVGGHVGADDLARPVIYSLRTGERLRILGPHPTTIESLLFSQDGNSLILGSRYEPVQILNLETGIATTLDTGRRNEWLCLSPDGSEMVAHATSKQLMITSLSDPSRRRTITVKFNIEYCQWIPGTSLLVCTNYADESIVLMNAYTGQIVADLHHSGASITSVVATADHRKVFAGRNDGSIASWTIPDDLLTSAVPAVIPPGSTQIEAVADETTRVLQKGDEIELQHQAIISMLIKDDALYCAGLDGGVCLYRFPLYEVPSRRQRGEPSPWAEMAFSPVTGDVLIGDINGKVSRITRDRIQFSDRGVAKLYGPDDFFRFPVFDKGSNAIDRITVSQDDTSLAYFDARMQVCFMKTSGGAEPLQVVVPPSTPEGDRDWIDLSPDGKWLAWTGGTRVISIARLDKADSIREIPIPSTGWSVRYSPDSTKFACGGNFDKLYIYDAESLELIHTIDECAQCTVVKWFSDNQSLLLGFDNGGIQRRSIVNDTPGKHSVHRMRVCSIALSEQDHLAFSADRSGQVALWNSDTGELYGLLFEPESIPRGIGVTHSSLEFLQNGELLHHFDRGVREFSIRHWKPRDARSAAGRAHTSSPGSDQLAGTADSEN